MWNIAVEVPVPNPDTPVQTETSIPISLLPEFETFAEHILAFPRSKLNNSSCKI